MYHIRTLNEISGVYKEVFDLNEYAVSAGEQKPDAIIVRSADMHNYTLTDTVAAVARAGAGYNNIPVDEFAKRGVVVFNTPGANANAVKEWVVAAMLLGSRDIVGGIEWAKTLAGKGADVPKLVEKGKGQFVGPELRGKTLGVIGLGEVGALVANAGRALDMRVLGFDTNITVDHAWMLSRAIHKAKNQEELLSEADYISVHVPLMDKTRGMIGAQAIAMMKPGAVLINSARGELVDEAALLSALESGHLRAYVTDFPNDNLIGRRRVVAVPHLGASTPESEDNCVVMASRQIDAYLKTGSIRHSVNYPDCELDPPEGHRIAILHANVPNVVGAYTQIIASMNINIGGMVNRSRGQFAYSVLDLDEMPDAALAERVRSLDTVYGVRII